MKYDDASWHYGGDFPADLPPEAGATHIGMFLAWAIINDRISPELADDAAEEVQAVRERRITGAQFLRAVCDEKFSDQDLDEIGNAFARSYYQGDDGDGYGAYIDDYEEILLGGNNSIYYVADTWDNYDRIALAIGRRFAASKTVLVRNDDHP